MYLKSIRAYGFKSFADKTDIDIKKGITVIVGPNGSGKSNVVDAIKWVLGEQSIKALRGTSLMSDVIFSGSKTRGPHTRASVSLLFDNSDHYLNSEFEELEVKRICYKTGENEYYLNNTQVRLKDITDIFIDSGAGRESFNIISQGKVSDIISSKPEDRRLVIEEAAGVLKYKKRKEETQRKLDKTQDNLERIGLIISELEINLDPLKQQADTAKKYLEFKEELQDIEISLMASDIDTIYRDYENVKREVESQKKLIEEMGFSGTQNDTSIDKLKLNLIKLETSIADKNSSLLAMVNELSGLSAEKQMAKERSKYETDDLKRQNNILNLKETEITIKKNGELIKKEIEDLQEKIVSYQEKSEYLTNEIKILALDKNKLSTDIQNKNKNLLILNNKKDILENNINNDNRLPHSVKAIINHHFPGVHNTLGNLIETEDKYALAIDTALGFNVSVLVVDDENVAKDCVGYLKQNNLGRATFFPINIISARAIDEEVFTKIKSSSDFIAMAADIVTYNPLYRGIIHNQLGNVIITKDIDSLNRLGKLINYRYRIISLDGEVLHQGGSITGGSSKTTSSNIKDKIDLEKTTRDMEILNTEIKILNDRLEAENNDYHILEDNYHQNSQHLIMTQELLKQKNLKLEELEKEIHTITLEIKGTKGVINNDMDKYLDSILKKYEDLTIKKELLEQSLNKLKNDKSDLNNEIAQKELLIRKNNSEYNTLLGHLKDKEVLIGKYDTKLDSLLNILNEEYSLSFEKAFAQYKLEIPKEEARSKVSSLKANIRDLGEVNIGSVREFERIDKRYSFLTTQRDDLRGGINNLNDIITSLDGIMEEKFAETFTKVNQEFSKVFKELFKGGNGFLSLTNPEDILNTGIDIVAEPPGKKLNIISLLSGGEMTLTAIALLFSILNIRPVPFCILDEIEANLDDVNVDTFGKYIRKIDSQTQFIIITHKKRTMEYADTLYGITMQESGVSKMVSVKIDNV